MSILNSRYSKLLEKKQDDFFGIDLRSLALVRVSLALIVLADLITRAQTLGAHYGQGSIFPQSLIQAFTPLPMSWSFHLLFGGPHALIVALFIAHALAAVFLLVGYKTRYASIALYLLTISLHHANPLISQGGDTLLSVALFIGMFLPWGDVFSVDRALTYQRHKSTRIVSTWSAALLLQIGFMYFFASFWKYGPEWRDGTAVYYALSSEMLATHLGAWMRAYPDFLKIVTFAVVYFQHAALLLLFFPYRTIFVRSVTVIGLVVMHISFGLSMHIGLFSYISIACLMSFIPTTAWERLATRLRSHFGGVTIYYDGDCGFCKRWSWIIYVFLALPDSAVKKAQDDPSILALMRAEDSWVIVSKRGSRHVKFEAFTELLRASPLGFIFFRICLVPFISRFGDRAYRFIANHRPRTCEPTPTLPPSERLLTHFFAGATAALGILYIAYIFVFNASSVAPFWSYIRMGESPQIVAQVFGIDQQWKMFAPSPPHFSGWHVIRGTLQDGSEIDLLRGGAPFTYDKPADIAHIYTSERMRRFITSLYRPEIFPLYESYAGYLCLGWNSSHTNLMLLRSVEIIAMDSETQPPGKEPGPTRPVSLYKKVACD